MVLVGRGAIGKTEMVNKTITNAAFIGGAYSRIKLYNTIYDSQDKPKIVVDEAEKLFTCKDTQNIIRQIANTTPIRRVEYPTKTYMLEDRKPYFYTSAGLLLITNRLITGDVFLDATLSRSLPLMFDPSDDEIIKYIRSWGENIKVINYLSKCTKINCRVYYHANNHYQAGKDWKKLIDELLDQPTLSEQRKTYAKINGVSLRQAQRIVR
jgi:hypothetical protein